MKSLILASTSPRRKDLLSRLGIPFDIVEPSCEETSTTLRAEEECLHFAEEKARSVAVLRPGALILASDTLISCDDEKLGKPKDDEDAFHILKKLSGRTHEVHTAVVLLGGEKELKHVETAKVTFRPMTDDEIRAYVSTGEPMGKAGAYAVQGRARSLFIENVEGDEEAVIGLPVALVAKWLAEIGLMA
jgi:septum formation protein